MRRRRYLSLLAIPFGLVILVLFLPSKRRSPHEPKY